MKYGKKDKTHKPFIQDLRDRCILHRDVAQNNIGCDVIVFLKGKTYFVELKSGDRPSDRVLTENEQELKNVCDVAGIPYIVCSSYKEFDKLPLSIE